MYVTGNDIRMMRECAGKSAQEIAASMGMSSDAEFQKWENDEGLPDMNEFLFLSMICGFDPTALMKTLVDKEGKLQLDDYQHLHGVGVKA